MKTLNLVCHAGARKVAREQVDAVETPVGTDTWKPISHGSFIDGVIESMAYGLEDCVEVNCEVCEE